MVVLALFASLALIVALVANRTMVLRAQQAEPEWLDHLRWELDHR